MHCKRKQSGAASGWLLFCLPKGIKAVRKAALSREVSTSGLNQLPLAALPVKAVFQGKLGCHRVVFLQHFFFFSGKAYLTYLDFTSNSSGGLVGKVGRGQLLTDIFSRKHFSNVCQHAGFRFTLLC